MYICTYIKNYKRIAFMLRLKKLKHEVSNGVNNSEKTEDVTKM